MARGTFYLLGDPRTPFAAEDIPNDAKGRKMLGVVLYDASGNPITALGGGGGSSSANLQIKDAAGVDTAVGYQAGNLNMPTQFAPGTSFTITKGDDPDTVGGDSDLLVPTITGSTSAYTVGDVIGGRIQLANALGVKRTGIWQSLYVRFRGSLTPALDFWLFDQQPVQNTADNVAFAWNSSDDGHLLWHASVENSTTKPAITGYASDPGDYILVPGATAREVACLQIGAPIVKSSGGQDLWLYITTRSVFTMAANDDMRTALGIARD